MGAWGIGPFENDNAAELLDQVRSGDFAFEAMDWAFEDPDYLEVDGGQFAIALGSLVQVARGELPLPAPDLNLSSFAAQLTSDRVKWIRAQVERALSGADYSELYDLWADTGELKSWVEASQASLPTRD